MTGIMGMLKMGVGDAVIYAIITNKNFKISEHILTKGLRYNKYAERQIERAKSFMKKHEEEGWDSTDDKGQPHKSYSNARIAIKKLDISCKYDSFSRHFKVSGQSVQKYQGELCESLVIVVRDLIKEYFGFLPSKEMVSDALTSLCLESTENPIVDFLDSLQWDGICRIETFFNVYLGTNDTEFLRVIGNILFQAAVRRARDPGCKFDLLIVLEGKQGSGKSSALEILAGKKYHSDQDIMSLATKEQVEAVEGVWIYEIGELTRLLICDFSFNQSLLIKQTGDFEFHLNTH